jgi:hypothetical protein
MERLEQHIEVLRHRVNHHLEYMSYRILSNQCGVEPTVIFRFSKGGNITINSAILLDNGISKLEIELEKIGIV